MNRACRKIGLLDHLGHGNLGDDATLNAVMQNIKSRWPDAVVIGLSLNPHDTGTRHGIPSYAIRRDSKLSPTRHAPAKSNNTSLKARLKAVLVRYRLLFQFFRAVNTLAVRMPKAFFQELYFLAESFRITKSLDVLVICGGGQLLDCWGGPWGFPYTLFKWIMLARVSRAKCYFINVGAGPLERPLSKWFVKHALSLADYVSFRDDKSRAVVQAVGFSRRTEVLVDNVYSFDACAANTRGIGRTDRRIVGLSPMAYCDPRRYWDKDQAAYDCYIRKFAAFGAKLVHCDYRLMLFSTDIGFDFEAIDDLTRALTRGTNRSGSRSIMCPPVLETEGLLSQMYLMDYSVTCRFHGVVFAHLMNIPVLALSHHPKVATLMNDLGLSEYCLDIRSFDSEVLMETFIRLTNRRDEVRDRMADKVEKYKVTLRRQFDTLFPQMARCGNERL
jgi:polysaccharide pyruvyl transferase WcaK-like protein